ncbi:hypothetical protein HW555_010013 [Spodoptera exigua]|uniref:SWIM-type domain-containing protein n=1 Tax=Spodoptera exigua TaxID=7107 RepID=A0A835GBI1_SPOEX|nr:hypothetical protein HW555_010013 [Spodoptera exigua]
MNTPIALYLAICMKAREGNLLTNDTFLSAVYMDPRDRPTDENDLNQDNVPHTSRRRYRERQRERSTEHFALFFIYYSLGYSTNTALATPPTQLCEREGDRVTFSLTQVCALHWNCAVLLYNLTKPSLSVSVAGDVRRSHQDVVRPVNENKNQPVIVLDQAEVQPDLAVVPHAGDQRGAVVDEQDIQHSIIHLPHISRPPNTSNSYIIFGCTGETRYRIPKHMKIRLLKDFNYYPPPFARVCEEHLLLNDFEILLSARNVSHDFNEAHIMDMMQILKTMPQEGRVDFENIETMDPNEVYFLTGRSFEQFNRMFVETPSLSRRSKRPKTALAAYLIKLKTGEPNTRLADMFHISRTTLEREMTTTRDCIKEEFTPLHLEGEFLILERGFRDAVPNVESCGYDAHMPKSSRLVTICRWVVEVVNGRFKRDFKIFRQDYFNRALPHMQDDFRNAAAITNAFHDPITDNVNASGFMERINNSHVIDYNLNSRRIPFQSMSVELPDVRGFPRLSEEELVMFALGTYQIKLARSYYSEHARNGVYTIEVYRENDDLNNLLNNYNITGNNFWLLRGEVQSRHTRSRIYHTYILVNSDHLKLAALNHYYCSCKSGRRTLGTCAHVMSIVWFLAYARYENIDHPAQFLDSIVIDENDL